MLAVAAATAAAIALAGRPGRGTRQVHIPEGNVAPEQISLEQTGPDKIGPDHIGPDKIGPDHIGPDKIGPDHIGPDHIGPDHMGREQIGPELAGIVSRLRRAMRRAARAADPGPGLSVAQLELLSCITEHPGIRPGQLARMLRLAPSSVATLLGGLQSAGYVTRTPGSDGDRRTASLDLSAAGAAAVTRWHRVNEDIIQAALAALPHRDQATLRDAAPALRDLTASIDAQAD